MYTFEEYKQTKAFEHNLEEIAKYWEDNPCNIRICVPKDEKGAFEYLKNNFSRYEKMYSDFLKRKTSLSKLADYSIYIETALCNCKTFALENDYSEYDQDLSFDIPQKRRQFKKCIKKILPIIRKAIEENDEELCNYLYIYFAACHLHF